MKKLLLVALIGLMVFAGSNTAIKEVATDVTPMSTCPGGNGGVGGGNCAG